MVGLKDISKISGLSIAQVSRALNNHKEVSEETRKKVIDIANELGYVKNINAKRLVTKQTKQIAIIAIGYDDKICPGGKELFYDIIFGANKYASEINYEVIIHLIDRDNKSSYLTYCKERALEGAIVLGAKSTDGYFYELITSDFPCVVVGEKIEGENKASVIVDDIESSKVAVNKLIEVGRKNIAMITGFNGDITSLNREKGYINSLLNSNIQVNKNLIFEGEFNYEIANTLADKMIELNVDGIFCASDSMAFGIIDGLKKCGKKIPSDISVIGFDGIEAIKYSTPKLATMKQNSFQKGYEASKVMSKILSGKMYERTTVIPCVFIEGETI